MRSAMETHGTLHTRHSPKGFHFLGSTWAILVGTALILLTGCYDPRDPDHQTYRLEPVGVVINDLAAAGDLDRDGRDEYVRYWEVPDLNGMAVLLLEDDGRTTVDQINYPKPDTAFAPHILDLGGSRGVFVLVPTLNAGRDSLFVAFIDEDARELGSLYLTSGEPRVDGDKEYAWDPHIWSFHAEDLTGDGWPELLTMMRTGFAAYPRGLLVHELPRTLPDTLVGGRLLDQRLIGGQPGHPFIRDLDGDRRLEMLLHTDAPNNEAEAGGLRDDQSYVVIQELTLPLPPHQVLGPMGGPFSGAITFPLDSDRDGDDELVAVINWGRQNRYEVERAALLLLEPERMAGGTDLNDALVDQDDLPAVPNTTTVVDLDRDGFEEILTLEIGGEIQVRHGDLAPHPLGAVVPDIHGIGLTRLEDRERNPLDLDGDGVAEIYLQTVDDHRLLLGPDLQVKAVAPGWFSPWQVVRHESQGPPLLVVTTPHPHAPERTQAQLMRLVPNPWWWWHRYGPGALGLLGPGALGLLGLGLVLAGGIGLARQQQRTRRLEQTQQLVVETDPRGVVLLRPDGVIERANARARQVLGLPFDPQGMALPHEDLRSMLAEAQALPLRRHRGRLDLSGEEIELTLEPLDSGDPQTRWVLFLEPEASAAAMKTWSLMAQRVAHDLKNPLTAILLTQQRLQTELRERAPSLAAELDPLSERIVDRVAHLRRMTRNFMKFVDLAEPELHRADLNAFVEQVQDDLAQDLPPDIHLNVELGAGLPAVRLDAEQLQTALENLVANAVNAMPAGGVLTVKTEAARGLRLNGDAGPRDYAVLEVLDTGEGMDREVRERAFEAGYTTSGYGTGLGLALVAKVVALHGGSVEVESEPGVGTAFSLYLPAEEPLADEE